jgi:hypothetical protein
MYSVGCGSPLSGCSLSRRFHTTFDCDVKFGENTCVTDPSTLWFLFTYPVSKPSYGLAELVPGCASWSCHA